jgi:hypothetical protein
MRERKGTGGRPSKGPRFARTIRFPESLYEAIEDAAAKAGYEVNDFVVEVMSSAQSGLFDDVVSRAVASGQESLPISA